MIFILLAVLLIKAFLLVIAEAAQLPQVVPIGLYRLSAASVVEIVPDEKVQSLLYVGVAGIVLADYLALAALIFWVLMEDSPQRERAFWRTRPISGTQVFLAKAIFIGLAAWPVQAALQLTVSAAVGYSWLQCVSVLGLLTYAQSLLVAMLVLAATLWKNALVGLITIALYVFTLAYVDDFYLHPAPRLTPWFMQVSLLVLAVGVIWLVYASRSRAKGYILLGLGTCVLLYYQVMA